MDWKSSFLPSFLIARATHSLFVCVFLWMKLNIIVIICIRFTNLCDSGTFWETLESHPLQGIGFS
jgi:hypothetical protein